MIKTLSTLIVLLASSAAVAEGSRQLGAHEHGVGQLDIAFEGTQIAMMLHAPGADIVGFEYAAETGEDRASVDEAVALLARPLDLFVLPASAGCGVVEARASLESDAEPGHHDHTEHGHKDDDHADHAAEGHTDEGHKDHHHGDHDHAKEDHAKEDHAGHDEDAGGAGHTEFHAEYVLDCADPEQVTLITFAYFDAFPNALELEVQLITDRGATAFEVEKAVPVLDLRDLF